MLLREIPEAIKQFFLQLTVQEGIEGVLVVPSQRSTLPHGYCSNVSPQAAERLTAKKAWVLITRDASTFARGKEKEEKEVCQDKIRQTGTRAEIDAVELAK